MNSVQSSGYFSMKDGCSDLLRDHPMAGDPKQYKPAAAMMTQSSDYPNEINPLDLKDHPMGESFDSINRQNSA